MLTIIALVISIILQFVAMVFAISLIRTTKYNSSWILLSIGLVIMAIRRLFDFLPYVNHQLSKEVIDLNSWLGVLVSLLMVIGVFYIRKIFKHIKKVDEIRQMSEKRVLNAVIITEEKERQRLAKELHDGLGPLLSTAKMSVSSLADDTVLRRKPIFENAIQAINESISSLKEISNNLSPHILMDFGLYKAVKNFVEKAEQSRNIGIEFSSNLKDKRFNTNIEIIFYRTVCELITNTLRHANAGKILISLDEEDDKIKLLYQDDGRGFDFQEVYEGKKDGMGLNNIRSRIASLNGTFHIDSWPNEGIIVSIEVQIP